MNKVYLIKEETLTDIIDPVRDITGNCEELTLSELTSDLDAANTLIETIVNKFTNADEIRYVQGTLRHLQCDIMSVAQYAFWGCASLTTVNLPNTTSIEQQAFYNCSALTTVDLPNVTSIEQKAFYGCKALTIVNLPNATSIEQYAFESCSSLTTVDLPNATSINIGAFRNCTSLTTVDLPLVTSIEQYAFYICSSLTTVNLPNATSIEQYAFDICTSLTTVDLPNVTSINNRAFRNCSALTTVILRSETLCALSNTDAFTATPIKSGGRGYIYVPKALLEDYKAATNWSTYKNQFRAIEDYPEITGGDA